MAVFFQIASHVAITLIAVVGLALRIEHRLTKIETDVTWLKGRMNPGPKGEETNGERSKVDQT